MDAQVWLVNVDVLQVSLQKGGPQSLNFKCL